MNHRNCEQGIQNNGQKAEDIWKTTERSKRENKTKFWIKVTAATVQSNRSCQDTIHAEEKRHSPQDKMYIRTLHLPYFIEMS